MKSRAVTHDVMSTKQDTHVAIVTGASRGIGKQIALRLAADGFAVVVNYAGKAEDANAVVQEIEAKQGKAIAIKADVSNSAEVAQLFDQTEQAFGAPDVLVNNAGIMIVKPLAEFDDNSFARLTNINLGGTFNTLRQAATRLRSGGRIINLSTSVVGLYTPGYSVYAATKAAVETLTIVFAKELRGKSISVNAVAPGPTGTDLFFEGKSEELIATLSKMPPLERLGRPEDIASVVSFLAGPDGGWINGQIIRANGGIV